MNNNRRKRIAIVNQRYGLEVNGGSEYYARQLAEHLIGLYDVEVLTTRASDCFFWADHYQQDVEIINGVLVIRFGVERPRNPRRMERLEKRLKKHLAPEWAGERWVEECGPLCPDLVSYIANHADDYDAFVFVTYMYYPAVKGIATVANKSILVPTAHDDQYIHFPFYRDVFEAACALAYLTDEEESLVESLFDVAGKTHAIIGCGVDLPSEIDNRAFRAKYGIEGDYVIYVGRIGFEKGCDRMIAAFQKYCNRWGREDLKLILAGQGEIEVSDDAPIRLLGFISEQDKFDAIAGAVALWLPSEFESLSIAVLEAMALGVPVLVNGKCKVLKAHCEKSHSGWAYYSEDEAAEMLREIVGLPDKSLVSAQAERYIAENFTWDITTGRLIQLIENLPPCN